MVAYGKELEVKKSFIRIESVEDLMPKLRGRVFHVTPTYNMPSIEESGMILSNQSLAWESLFGNSVNGFFRLMNCVSFFDYRNYKTREFEEHVYKCLPTNPLRETSSISILFLAKSEFKKLASWVKWKEQEKWSQRVVPHVEAGYPGPVKLEYITEQLVVVQDCAEVKKSLRDCLLNSNK